MRQGMRRCLTCDYRLDAKTRNRATRSTIEIGTEENLRSATTRRAKGLPADNDTVG